MEDVFLGPWLNFIFTSISIIITDMYNNYPAVILMFAIFELRDQRRRLVSRGDICYQNYILAKNNVNAACPKCHNEKT